MKRDAGFSLLELAVVLTIFALVALIGAQVLQVTTRSNERLTEISETSADLAKGLALLRSDLATAVPRDFFPSGGGQEPALTLQQNGFSVSVAGLAQLSPGTTGFGRVEWRFDPASGTLERVVWTSRNPGARQTPGTTVLTDVSGFRVEAYDDQRGWGTSATLKGGKLPRGIRVSLQHARAGEVTVLENLQ